MKKILPLFIVAISFSYSGILAQNSPCSAPTMDLNTTCNTGDVYYNEFTNTFAGTSTIDATCSSGNETTESVTWVQFTATSPSVTLTNQTNYVGSNASDIEDKDFAIFSGPCTALTQVGCAAAVNGGGGTATFTNLTVGTTYWVMVSRSDNSLQYCPTCNADDVCITAPVASTLAANPCNACTSPCNLTTNTTYTFYNGNATADAFICSGSVENNVWYQWCAPSTWPAGQTAYISVYNQFCTTGSGLQLTVWNIGSACPTGATNANVVCANPGATTAYYYQWTASANTCYRIVIDGYGGTVCSYALTVGSVTVLPISLASFDATKKDNAVAINWTTASEKNNKLFTVEKSVDGLIFEGMANVAGAGTTSAPHKYSVMDYKPFSGTSYYRLKQIDFDGNDSYSQIVSVNNAAISVNFDIIPNPANEDSPGDLRFNMIPPGEVTLNIFDLNGRAVYSDKRMLTEASYSLPKQFQKGVYVVKVNMEDILITKRLLIK